MSRNISCIGWTSTRPSAIARERRPMPLLHWFIRAGNQLAGQERANLIRPGRHYGHVLSSNGHAVQISAFPGLLASIQPENGIYGLPQNMRTTPTARPCKGQSRRRPLPATFMTSKTASSCALTPRALFWSD